MVELDSRACRWPNGDPQDKEHLLVAGAYHVAMAAREAGKSAEAAELIATVTKRFPSDPEMQMFAAESLLRDGKDAQAAIDALAKVTPPDGSRILIGRKATLQADAYEAAGQKDQAIAVLEKAVAAFPNPRMQQRIDKLKGAGK
jgi:predicted Zn-dependent protease